MRSGGISDWKLKPIPVVLDDGHVSPEEAKIRDTIRLYITSDDEEEEALSTLTGHIWDEDDPEWEQVHEAEDESVCPDSPIVLVNEGGKLVRVYPYWKWKSHVEDYEFVPIKRAFECRDEAKLEGTYSSDDEGDDDSTVESLKKGSGRIPKYEFVFELEDMPTSEVNSNREEDSLALQLEELENIHGEHLNSAADDDEVPALLSGQSMSSDDSVGSGSGREAIWQRFGREAIYRWSWSYV